MTPEGHNTDSYEQVRDWYLARLRRQALPAPSTVRLTPSRLVKVDAEVVKQLISGKIQKSTSLAANTDKSKLAGISVGIIGAIIGPVLLLPCFFLLVFCLALGGDPESADLSRILLLSAIALIILSAAAVTIFALKVGQIASSVQSNIIGAVAGDLTLPHRKVKNQLVWLSSATSSLVAGYTAARERERAIADFASSLICSIDEKGNFTAVSPSCMWILGYTKEQLSGSSMLQLVTPEDASKTLRALEKAKLEKYARFENSMLSAQEKVVHMEWDFEWSESARVCYATGRDITELKNLERLKQEFMEMLTHDMRSPLAAVISNTKLLLAGAFGTLEPEPIKRLKIIERTGNRLLTLVNEILDIDRMESGKLELDLKEILIIQMVESAQESVQALAEAKDIKIEMHVEDGSIVADEIRLVNVLINLLGNAIKFSPPNSTINIEAAMTDQKDMIEFRVVDQGRGIAAGDQEKIFDRFKQIEIKDATVKGGSGLGLAICKSVVESHHGVIGVSSQTSTGSTFWFRIPLKQATEATAEEPLSETSAKH